MIKAKAAKSMVESWIKQFSIKTGSAETKAQFLSGGNLQKLIAARELRRIPRS